MRWLFVLVLMVSTAGYGDSVSTGPANGSLVVVGGGEPVAGIMQRFIDLAGGPDAGIVVIPTAAGATSYDENAIAKFWSTHGAHNVTVLHTTNRQIANSPEFVDPIRNSNGVWFSGGRQWRLVDAYKDTQSEQAFWHVLNKGGVIGGSSAGATIQGSYLARGDTKNNQIMMGDHEEGFGFIQNIAIDQHVLARNRHFDMFDILRQKPELLGIGIDESTALIVKGDEFEVIGNGYVLVYDNSFWSREGSNLKRLPPVDAQFYFLRDGDRYNLKTRTILPPI